ncbi:MAG: preprotein translocase subunit SecE [Candidatus Berkelbacteria bacterium]
MIESIQKFFIGSYEELKKVVWPSRKVVINHTIIVIVSVVVSMAILVALDYGLFSVVQKLIYR